MGKTKFIQRYKCIIEFLKTHPYATFEQINERLGMVMYDKGIDHGFSVRTFQRDIKDMAEIYDIDIQYDKSKKGYHIEQINPDWTSQRLMESFDVMNIIQMNDSLTGIIDFEKHATLGTNHLFGIIHAIKNNYKIAFTHHSYWKTHSEEKTVSPYGLKEYQQRWYLVGVDQKDNRLKTFGLDRFTNFAITNERYQIPKAFNLTELFKNSFGIILGNQGEQPQEVILSFTPNQGKYVKSLPLHHTQKTLIDNNEEFRISINVYLTYDLEMKICSMSNQVEVVAPTELRDRVQSLLQDAVERYVEV